MLADLRTFMIFLHGPSGAGKSEMHARLAEMFIHQGYTVFYASSGELFRAVYDDPVLAAKLRQGHFSDSLTPILPKLQDIYADFVNAWCDNEGQAVLILDGVIRRSGFVNQQGVRIPAQTRQVATAFTNAHSMNAGRWRSCFVSQLDNIASKRGKREFLISMIWMIRNAWHILLDVHPYDAERQIRRRAEKAIEGIRRQIEAKVLNTSMEPSTANTLSSTLESLISVINGVVSQGENVGPQDIQHETNLPIALDLYGPISEEVERIRRTLMKLAQLDESSPFGNTFKLLGLQTEIRDEDIPVSARQARLANYVQVYEQPGGFTYTPGFAAQAIVQEFGFRFQPDGTFLVSRRRNQYQNCIIVANGHSRGVGLDQFREQCTSIAQDIYETTEQARIKILADFSSS